MAKVNVREFKSRLSYYLRLAHKETVEVTNWDKVIANVVTPQVNKDNQINLLKSYISELEERLKNTTKNVVTASGIEAGEEVMPQPTMKLFGRCEKCKLSSTLTLCCVPTPNDMGDLVDVEMNLCSKCERNLNKFLDQ